MTSLPTTPRIATGTNPSGDLPARVPTPDIDASLRAPLALMFKSGLVWLLVALVLWLIASIKLHGPGFLGNAAWLTLGRVRPAAMNAFLYGFASQTALAVALWLLCRLGGVRLFGQGVLVVAGMFWNLAVTLGFVGILAGGTTGFEWLEMPRYVAPMLFVAHALIALYALLVVHQRRDRHLYVSHWYVVAAVFWFPWLLSAASLLLLYRPVRGVLQSVVNGWFTNNLYHLWFSALGLAILFYFIPKLTRRPLYSRALAAFGFWTLALFANWSGMTQFIGGPVPAWLVSASVAANLVLLVPLVAVAVNWHLTLKGSYRSLRGELPFRFLLFGALSYLVSGGLGVLLGLPVMSEWTHFTYVEVAARLLGLIGFVGMTLFGALYFIVPRVFGHNWPSARLAAVHFGCSAAGVALLFVALLVGGLLQGQRMNLDTVDFVSLGKGTMPFVGVATLGWLLLLAGQVAFAVNAFKLLYRVSEPFRASAVALIVDGASKPNGVKR